MTAATIVSHLGLFLVFFGTVRVVGIGPAQVSWAEVLGVFSLSRLLSELTFGGVGVVELTYTAGLAEAPSAPRRSPPRCCSDCSPTA